MLISTENKEGEKIYHIFQQRHSQLGLKLLKAGRCKLHLPEFEGIYQDQGVQQSLLHQSFGWCTYCSVGAFRGGQQSLLHQPSFDCCTIARLVLLGGAAVSAAPTKLRLMNYCSVGALETSAPPTDTKKGLQSRLTLKTSSKEGSYLLSRIALQYHRRKRA